MLLIISILKIVTVLEFILQNVQKILKQDIWNIIHCLWLFYINPYI